MNANDCRAALDQAHPIAQRLADALAAGGPAEVLVACRTAITEFIGCDDVLLTQLDVQHDKDSFVAAGETLATEPELTCELIAYGAEHPVVRSYMTLHDDGRPRRASDVADPISWHRYLATARAFREHGGTHQLSMVVSLNERQGRGWILTRGTRDFTEAELQRAGLLLPALTVIDRLCRPSPPSDVVLTAREVELLHLLAGGLSARLMSRRLGISERTVTKHLEHLYRKLGTRDRVSTINAGQRHGLLGPHAGPVGRSAPHADPP
jgi:DNA-binding CsgD family transcriptional regulator